MVAVSIYTKGRVVALLVETKLHCREGSNPYRGALKIVMDSAGMRGSWMVPLS